MIQRIQTVYLLLSLILMGLTGWLPLGELLASDVIYNFDIKGVSNNGEILIDGLPLIIMLAIILVLQLVVIFDYKKRVRQMRITTLNVILMMGFFGVSWFFVKSSLDKLGSGAYVFQMAMVFPVVAVILNYLAIRAIGKDEALIKSIDRIR